jgi:hypothetical protein
MQVLQTVLRAMLCHANDLRSLNEEYEVLEKVYVNIYTNKKNITMQCFLLHLENRKRSAEIVSFKSDTELRCTRFCTSTLSSSIIRR